MEPTTPEEKQPEETKDAGYYYRFLKTGFLLCIFCFFGMSVSIGGPSVPDLSTRLCVTLSQYSVSMSVGAAGSLFGSITFGLLIDRFQSKADLLMSCSLTFVAFCLLIKPFIPWLWLFIIVGFIEAIGYSGIDAGANCMLFRLWGQKVNSPMHALHLVWGLGFTIGPFVVRPYLGSDKNNTLIGSVNYTCIDDSRIEVPFIICSTIMFIIASVALALFLTGPPKGLKLQTRPIKKLAQVFDVSAIGGGDKKFGITILILFALFYFGNAGREHTFSSWLFTYAIESDLDFTKQEAALLDAATKGSFTIGRLISTPLAHFLPVQPMLFMEVYVVMILVVGLATLGTKEKIYLWVFSCLINAISSPIWPGGLTWTDKYIPVTAIVLTVMTIGAASAAFLTQWFTGWLFTYKSPDDVMYLFIGCSALLCVLLVIMQIVASRKGNRFDRETEKENKIKIMPNQNETHLDSSYNNSGTDVTKF